MNKQFFSLIHGEAVHLAPEVKFIPASEFSTLMDSKKILEKVKVDAEEYQKGIVKECEKLKEAAQIEGFNKGFEAWASHVAKLEEEIVTLRKDAQKAIIPITLTVAKKIVGKEIELSKEIIVDIVLNNLKAVSTHKKITIYVSKKDLAILENKREQLKQVFEGLEALSIRERADIEPGGCIIETEGGIINAKIENQWDIMETAFQSILKTVIPENPSQA